MLKRFMNHDKMNQRNRQRKSRLPRIWKIAGKTIDFD